MKLFPSYGGAPYSPRSLKVIRLILHGCANRPFFHISIMEKRKERDDPVIEQIGCYDPLPNEFNEKIVAINYERLEYWLANGVKLTEPVAKLLGLSGYLPIHYSSFTDAWQHKKMIKAKLEELKTQVTNLEKANTASETSSSSAESSSL